nr:putative ribonuclease H-like domain-containing protein [Tanacetum cinerariifolium]
KLPTLNDTKMVLELADRTISKPTGVAKNVFVKLDKIIIRQDQQYLTIQCGDISSIKKVEQINKIDFIDAGGIDFESEEIENFLNNDSIPFRVEDSLFNMEEDIIFLKSLLREDPIPPHPIITNQTKLPIEEPNHSFNMGYEHFNTNLLTKDVTESSTKNLIPIPNECMVVSENRSQSTEPVNDNSSDFTIISNLLFDNDKINSDELNSYVEFNSDESTSNHVTVKNDYLDEFYRPFIPIHILEEERTRKGTCRLHQPNGDESNPHQEEIDVVSVTNDVLPPSDDDSDEEVDGVGDLRVDNVIQNSEYEYSESEDSDFDNPLLPLPPPEPPDKEFDFKIDFQKEISVVRNAIVKFECIDARVKFDVFNDENDVLSYFMFVIFAKEFSLLSAESEDTIFDPGFFPEIEVFLCWIYVRFLRSSHPLIDSSLGKSISFDLYCLADETASVLKTFIIGLENLLSIKIKIIRCDNGTEFKNVDLNQFYGLKGIKREFSVPRTPQQNGIAEMKNRTLIDVVRTLLTDSLLPIPFWAEAVNTACYVQNRVLVTKPHNKTPYELLHGRLPSISFMRPFGYPNNNKDAHANGKEHDDDIQKSVSPDIHSTSIGAQTRNQGDKTENKYKGKSPVVTITGFRDLNKEFEECINNSSNGVNAAEFEECINNSSNGVNAAGSLVSAAGLNFTNITNDFSVAGPSNTTASPPVENSALQNVSTSSHDAGMPNLEDYTHSDDADDVGAEADINNLKSTISVSPIPTSRIHKDHPTA